MGLKKPFDVDKARRAFGEQFVPPPKSRYFYTRDRNTGKYRIVDRELHRGMVIATADFKEIAEAIVDALNSAHKAKQTIVIQGNIFYDHTAPRPAVLGDLDDDWLVWKTCICERDSTGRLIPSFYCRKHGR